MANATCPPKRLSRPEISYADKLVDARQNDKLFGDFTDHPGRPQTLSDGYRIQTMVVEKLGGRVIGVKAGLSTESAMRAHALGKPIFSPILDGDVIDVGVDGPAFYEIPKGGVIYETEIAIVMRPNGCFEAFLSVELARLSFGPGGLPAVPDIVADLAGGYKFFRGPKIPIKNQALEIKLTADVADTKTLVVPEVHKLEQMCGDMAAFVAAWYDMNPKGDDDFTLFTGSLHSPVDVQVSCRFAASMNEKLILELILR